MLAEVGRPALNMDGRLGSQAEGRGGSELSTSFILLHLPDDGRHDAMGLAVPGCFNHVCPMDCTLKL